ncbi:MAG: NUDIX domain-containing protein [Verrucomicrobiales bacterium]|nr:NUDIX domain-containing protein [Verrucomicrobiales bacterium]
MGKYRSNVAALMINKDGYLLVCERLRNPGAWQFPQGGVNEGESLEAAIVREVEEEIGLEPKDYRVERSKGVYRYDYPPEAQKNKLSHKVDFVGQEQTYFLCQLNERVTEVNLMQEPREFRAAKWIRPSEFESGWLPDFKKKTYREVMRDFFGVELAEVS